MDKELKANRPFFKKNKPTRKICPKTGKTCYKNERETVKSSKAFSRSYKPDHKTHAYFCGYCKYFHNGTSYDL